MKTKCSATTKIGNPCRSWAIRESDPPLCGAHKGKPGAPPGNTNAVKHGFYRRVFSDRELSDLLEHSQTTTLEDELALSRILLQRLMIHLISEDIPLEDLAAIAPLVFTGARTVAHLLRDLENAGSSDFWSDVLDNLSDRLDIPI